MFIDADGNIYPPDAAELINEANSVRFYMCLRCLELFEIPVGDEGKHECEEKAGGPASATDAPPATA